MGFERLSTFPTAFYVLSLHSTSAFKFKTRPMSKKPIPTPFLATICDCEELIVTATKTPLMQLQCIHISRALLHLSVSLVDSDKGGFEELWMNQEIRSISKAFEAILNRLSHASIDGYAAKTVMDLEHIFLSCCEHYAGAVAIRHTYAAYKKMVKVDLQDIDNSINQVNREGLNSGMVTTDPYIKPLVATFGGSRPAMLPHEGTIPPFTLPNISISPITDPNAQPGPAIPPDRDNSPIPHPELIGDTLPQPSDDQDGSKDVIYEAQDLTGVPLEAFPDRLDLWELANNLLRQEWLQKGWPEPDLEKLDDLTQKSLQGLKHPRSRFEAFFDPMKNHRCRWYKDGERCQYTTLKWNKAVAHSRLHFQYKSFQCGGRCGTKGCLEKYTSNELLRDHISRKRKRVAGSASYLPQTHERGTGKFSFTTSPGPPNQAETYPPPDLPVVSLQGSAIDPTSTSMRIHGAKSNGDVASKSPVLGFSIIPFIRHS